MMDMEQLERMSVEDLEKLIAAAQEVLRRKKAEDAEEFEFDFEASTPYRHRIPYVARLRWRDGKIHREFFDIDITFGKSITAIGRFKARVGDIIEQRTGGSAANEYRYWFLVTSEGKLYRLCDVEESRRVAQVKRYLRGEITMEELIEATK